MMSDTYTEFGEFKLLAEQGREYFGFFLRGVALYLIILGALLKFMLDAAPDSNERTTFWAFGMLLNVGSLPLSLYALRLYREMSARSSSLAQKLGTLEIYRPIINVAGILIVFVGVTLVAWASLYFFV